MLNKDWAPNESSTAIFTERCILAGWFLGAVALGVHLTLFIWCFRLLYFKKKQLSDWLHLAYICLSFIFSNIGNGLRMKSAELIYIDHRNYPGGPSAAYIYESSSLIIILSDSAHIINTWLQDALILYRFWIIFSGNLYFFVLPALMFFASVVIAIMLVVELSHPDGSLWSKTSANLAISTWTISIGLNVVLTLLIVARLMYMRHRLRKILGNRGSDYLSITAMLVESAALFTFSGLWFIIPYALNSPISHLALPLLSQTVSIAPLLVILRVLQGRAWSKNTMAHLNNSGIRFRKSDLYSTTHDGRHESVAIALEGIHDTTSTHTSTIALGCTPKQQNHNEDY